MNTYRFISIVAVISLFAALVGCSKRQPASPDEALALYRQNKLEQALPLFEALVAEDANNPEKHVWLAETYRRLGKKAEAIKEARRALELEPHNSFAHTVIAEASNPVVGVWAQANSDTTWFHLMKAVECDSFDAHPWLVIWGEAIHHGNPSMSRQALRRIAESGFLTKAALSYGRWMLRGLPENAVLMTNGDMDTYPPCAVQEAEGFRRDVVVVNRGTLNEPWYARFIRDQGGVSLPFDDARLERMDGYKDAKGELVTPSDQIFRGWLEQKAKGTFKRPLAVAVSVEESYYSSVRDNMRFAGAFLLWSDVAKAKTSDVSSMLASLKGVSPDDFTGPWVSDKDRSPVRRLYTKNIARNVTLTAIMCGESLLDARRISDAQHWTQWAEELDKKAEVGPFFADRIARLKEQLAQKTQ